MDFQEFEFLYLQNGILIFIVQGVGKVRMDDVCLLVCYKLKFYVYVMELWLVVIVWGKFI